MIVIVDYKTGNIASVKNAIDKIGFTSTVSSDPNVIGNATKLILPGVGSFGNGVKMIQSLGLWDVLNKKVIDDKTPILGICLGAQIMTNSSEEDMMHKGFGWVNAETVRFNFNDKTSKMKVPNIGWLEVKQCGDDKIYHGINDIQSFYFSHSYHFSFNEDSSINGMANYGYNFPASFVKNNIIGIQFHPEKSHSFGLNLIKNFITKY
jgi:glutamine amidotransferase